MPSTTEQKLFEEFYNSAFKNELLDQKTTVMIHLASEIELPASYANELREIVRDAMHDPELSVTVVAVRGFWRSNDDAPPHASP